MLYVTSKKPLDSKALLSLQLPSQILDSINHRNLRVKKNAGFVVCLLWAVTSQEMMQLKRLPH
jgi:hypothetical protein